MIDLLIQLCLLFAVLLVFLLIGFLILRAILMRMAQRISAELDEKLQQAMETSISAAKATTATVLSKSGADLVAFKENLYDKSRTNIVIVSEKIQTFAESRNIDLEKARVKFFENTEKMARLMDYSVNLPVIGGIGLDATLGWFLPVVGDMISKGVSVLIIINSMQYRIPRKLVSKMIANSFTDLVLGLIPLLGNIIDVFYRANKMNIELLRDHLIREEILQSTSGKKPGETP